MGDLPTYEETMKQENLNSPRGISLRCFNLSVLEQLAAVWSVVQAIVSCIGFYQWCALLNLVTWIGCMALVVYGLTTRHQYGQCAPAVVAPIGLFTINWTFFAIIMGWMIKKRNEGWHSGPERSEVCAYLLTFDLCTFCVIGSWWMGSAGSFDGICSPDLPYLAWMIVPHLYSLVIIVGYTVGAILYHFCSVFSN
jgi:hypothetical protein